MVRNAFVVLFLAGAAAFAGAKSEDGIVYGEAGGEKLTMDYYPPAGPAPHPIAIIIHGGGFVGGGRQKKTRTPLARFPPPARNARGSGNPPPGGEIPPSREGGRGGGGGPRPPADAQKGEGAP